MATPQNPLTEEDRQELDTALSQLDEARTLIDQAKRAGIDVQAFEDRARQTRERVQRIRQTFFPNQ